MKTREKICIGCKKLFNPRNRIQVYCGSRVNQKGCAFKLKREVQRVWAKRRRDKLRDIEKKYYKLLKLK